MNTALLFEPQPMVRPKVMEAHEQAVRVLRKARTPEQIARIRGMRKARPHPAGKLA